VDTRQALAPLAGATPLVFAHRGSSAALPEHTVAAYERAVVEGVDGFECDVRLTRDRHLVCIHDASIARTSNGRGRVTRLTLAELNRHDYTSWHREWVATRGPDAVRVSTTDDGILTLDRLLSLARGAGRSLRLLIETKHPSRFGGDVERQLVDLLTRHGLTGATRTASEPDVRVIVMSFSIRALRRVRALAPEIPTVFLFDIPTPSLWSGRPPDGADLLGPSIRMVRHCPEVVRRAHDRGVGVLVWTVNRPADIELVHSLGVDGIVTDRPADVLAALNRPVPGDRGGTGLAAPTGTGSPAPGDGRLGPCPSTTGVSTTEGSSPGWLD
jgi:glycerophosphoryl diester phosphodiesterase